MQVYAFPRTSGARNPIVIVRITIGPEQGTCEVPIVFQMIIIRVRAGNLQGTYLFFK